MKDMNENILKGLMEFIIKDVSYEFYSMSNQIFLNSGNGLITNEIKNKIEHNLIQKYTNKID